MPDLHMKLKSSYKSQKKIKDLMQQITLKITDICLFSKLLYIYSKKHDFKKSIVHKKTYN